MTILHLPAARRNDAPRRVAPRVLLGLLWAIVGCGGEEGPKPGVSDGTAGNAGATLVGGAGGTSSAGGQGGSATAGSSSGAGTASGAGTSGMGAGGNGAGGGGVGGAITTSVGGRSGSGGAVTAGATGQGGSATGQGGSATGQGGSVTGQGGSATSTCVSGVQTATACNPSVDTTVCVRSDCTCTCDGASTKWSCVPTTGTGGSGNGAGGAASAGGSDSGSGGSGTGGSGTGGSTSTGAVFSECRFHFGAIDTFARDVPGLADQLDFFTPGWMGQSDSFDMDYVCDEANPGKQLSHLVPVIVSYVIAFTARRDENLQDCNVSGSNNLCNYGATYLRAHTEDRILPNYETYARGFANCYGTTRPIIFLMEPDFYQYHAGGDPNALTPAEAGALMTRIVNTMKSQLPNAVFSMDISPWIPNNGQDWYSNFDMDLFTFMHTSGGGTEANNTRIRSNNDMTWAGVSQVTGKPILADTGYGVAGSSAGHDSIWDAVANINARINDGVLSINQYNPNNSWPTTISSIRSQLSKPVYCQ